MNTLNLNVPALAAAALATTLVLGSTAALADEVRVYDRASSPAQMARVISATPNIERFVETRQQCSEQVQQVTTQGSSNLGGVLVGSVIGGVAGSAIGKGTGKTIATATGAALGAQVARNYGEQPTTTSKVSCSGGGPLPASRSRRSASSRQARIRAPAAWIMARSTPNSRP